ncbi:putative copper homeostasis (lipo)protein LpqS [Mycolicibacterium setense]
MSRESRMLSLSRLAAMMVIAVWVAGLAGQWQSANHDHPTHLPHSVSAAIGDGAELMMLDHPHVGDSPASHTPDAFAAAVLPRGTATAATLSVVGFIVGCALLCGCAVVWSQRGPPDQRGVLLAGQRLLIRICIARR